MKDSAKLPSSEYPESVTTKRSLDQVWKLILEIDMEICKIE